MIIMTGKKSVIFVALLAAILFLTPILYASSECEICMSNAVSEAECTDYCSNSATSQVSKVSSVAQTHSSTCLRCMYVTKNNIGKCSFACSGEDVSDLVGTTSSPTKSTTTQTQTQTPQETPVKQQTQQQSGTQTKTQQQSGQLESFVTKNAYISNTNECDICKLTADFEGDCSHVCTGTQSQTQTQVSKMTQTQQKHSSTCLRCMYVTKNNPSKCSFACSGEDVSDLVGSSSSTDISVQQQSKTQTQQEEPQTRPQQQTQTQTGSQTQQQSTTQTQNRGSGTTISNTAYNSNTSQCDICMSNAVSEAECIDYCK
jgi:hypothetical protein